QSTKRSFKGGSSPSVPIANSFQDLSRAMTGHPLLSHSLSMLAHKHTLYQCDSPLYEIDSLGLFFYGSAGDTVRIESSVKDDFMKVIEMKRILLEKSILTNDPAIFNSSKTVNECASESQIFMSFDNLKLLSNSIPPNGKTSWLLPF